MDAELEVRFVVGNDGKMILVAAGHELDPVFQFGKPTVSGFGPPAKLRPIFIGFECYLSSRTLDDDYRLVLMGAGVPRDLVENCSPSQLDCIGRILCIYRPGVSMEQADPVHYGIMKAKFERAIAKA